MGYIFTSTKNRIWQGKNPVIQISCILKIKKFNKLFLYKTGGKKIGYVTWILVAISMWKFTDRHINWTLLKVGSSQEQDRKKRKRFVNLSSLSCAVVSLRDNIKLIKFSHVNYTTCHMSQDELFRILRFLCVTSISQKVHT